MWWFNISSTRDRYGHWDDAIERFQARKQKLFVESINAMSRKHAVDDDQPEDKDRRSDP
jgi:hypothetical protein